jgi:hypothetical protein
MGAWCVIFFVSILFLPTGARAAQVTLAWNASQGATGYKIYYGTASGHYSWLVSVGNVTGYTFGNLPDGYIYYFAATAYDGFGNESDYSDEVSFNASATPGSSYALTVTKAGTGTGTVTTNPAGTSFAGGTVVTLTATAAAGSYFTGWGFPCSGNGACTFTIGSNTQITATFNPVGNLFIDVPPGYWAESYINALYNAGYTTGYGGTNEYEPEYEVNREQMAALIIRATGGEPATNYCSTGSPFPDCKPSDWSCKYIKRLYELGITTGYGNTGLFMPWMNVTRGEMAAFIVRAIEGEPDYYACLFNSPFTDVTASDWSCKYIKRLYELGITTGYGDGRFGPEDLVTRAQMAVFIGRAFLDMP